MDAPLRSPGPSPRQRALADRLATGEMDRAQGILTLDTDRYRDPHRFAAEMASLFADGPLMIAPSALLPGAAQAAAHDATGRALILSRDAQGRFHALPNACRHRGTRLVEGAGCQPAKRLVCPYHAWAYHPDGRLAGLPRADTFPGLALSDHDLPRLPVLERGGLLWLGETDGAARTVSDEIATLGLADHHLYARNTHAVAANWKLIVDAFLESYHVQRLHAASIAGFFADGVTLSERIGPHQCALVARAERLADCDRGDWSSLRRAATFTYHLFPATILVVSPDYVNILVCHPQSAGHTLVEDFMLVPEPPADPAAEAHWAKSWALIDGQVFASEDFVAAARCQQGIDTSTLPDMTLGELEHGLARFHAEVDARL